MMTFLARYGALTVFSTVLFEHIGLPIPAVPVLLAAGALIAAGHMSWSVVIFSALAAALLGDLGWYEVGKRHGAKVLGTLCRISMEPDTCVRRTENTFVRYGVKTLTASKFIPGFNRIAPPLAGIFNVPLHRFILFDGLGAFLYSGIFVVLGYFFHAQIDVLLIHLAHFGKSAGLVVLGLLALYIFYKYGQRQWTIRQLRIARITPEELGKKIAAGTPPVIIDLRSALEIAALPYLIPGAIHILPEKIDERCGEIPRGREIVVYCSCPTK